MAPTTRAAEPHKKADTQKSKKKILLSADCEQLTKDINEACKCYGQHTGKNIKVAKQDAFSLQHIAKKRRAPSAHNGWLKATLSKMNEADASEDNINPIIQDHPPLPPKPKQPHLS